MIRACDKQVMKPLYLSFFISLGLATACQDRGDGPKPPEPDPILVATQDVSESGDASGQGAPKRGSTASAGLNALPDKYMSGVSDCQKQMRYYDLQLASCTETPLADFTCDLTVLLSEDSAVLSAEQKRVLKEYIDANLPGFSLYACTIDEARPKLHFYKVESDRIRAHNVKIAAPQ